MEEARVGIDIRGIPKLIESTYAGSLDRNSIEYWQTYIFHLVAIAGAFFGTICMVVASIVLLYKGWTLSLAFVLLIYASNMVVILLRRFRVRTKTIFVSFNFYLFGLVSLVFGGPLGESGIWFSVCVLMCSLFAGLRSSLFFACLNLLTGLAFGILHTKGLVGWESVRSFPFASWILQCANIFLVNLMFTVADVILIKGVGSTFMALTTAEGKVRTALAEKETLLRELYHRTKNNMQVVSSLLLLNSRELDAEAPKAVFKDVINKIGAMSLVHQKLYESKDLSNIGLREYIGELVSLLAKSYGASAERVDFHLDIEDLTMPIDAAVPCGLVISEIVSNSLKHAFPGDRRGRISIGLKGSSEDLELTISDDGVGLPEGFDRAFQGRMGMKTLFTMVEHQLRGAIEFRSEGGLYYTIRFKRSVYDEKVRAHG
jgi:two-component sensor histidine kinase